MMKETLIKAIEEAIEHGWSINGHKVIAVTYKEHYPSWQAQHKGSMTIFDSYSALIFSHDFAKALWGEDRWWSICDRHEFTGWNPELSGDVIPYWKAMLQQMVIAEDPIKYLGVHI